MTILEALNAHKQQIFFANKQKGFWELPAFQMVNQKNIVVGEFEAPDWWVRLKKAEKIALMHSELSEALEGIRKDAQSDKIPGFTAEEEELADAYIRIMDHAGGFGLRLAEAVMAKLEYNAGRPFRHGKNF